MSDDADTVEGSMRMWPSHVVSEDADAQDWIDVWAANRGCLPVQAQPGVPVWAIDPMTGGWMPNYGSPRSTEPMPVPPTPAPPAHDHARYPHLCPHCGKAAYVGLNAIEHEHDARCE